MKVNPTANTCFYHVRALRSNPPIAALATSRIDWRSRSGIFVGPARPADRSPRRLASRGPGLGGAWRDCASNGERPSFGGLSTVGCRFCGDRDFDGRLLVLWGSGFRRSVTGSVGIGLSTDGCWFSGGRTFDGRARPGSINHSPADPSACALPARIATHPPSPLGESATDRRRTIQVTRQPIDCALPVGAATARRCPPD
jgi:hypothetical protein